MQPYELFIGLRYTRAKRRNHFISFISLISMLGIGLGVMALIVVLSVMNGFQKEIRARILGITPHLQISSDSGQLNDWQQAFEYRRQASRSARRRALRQRTRHGVAERERARRDGARHPA